MAKGLRNKQKKRNRREMRATVGAPWEKKKMEETQKHLRACMSRKSNLGSIRERLGAALGLPTPQIERDETEGLGSEAKDGAMDLEGEGKKAKVVAKKEQRPKRRSRKKMEEF